MDKLLYIELLLLAGIDYASEYTVIILLRFLTMVYIDLKKSPTSTSRAHTT